MAGLPKKYARMGFKKGWAAYKKTSKKVTTRRVSTMAKKRRKAGSKKQAAKGTALFKKVMYKALPLAYGFAREPMSNWLAKSELGKNMPNFGRYGDEGTLLLLNYGATALGARKNVIARKALQIVEDVELASVGREFYFSRKEKKQMSDSDFAI